MLRRQPGRARSSRRARWPAQGVLLAAALALAALAYVVGFSWVLIHQPHHAMLAAILGMALAACLTAAMLYAAYRRMQLLKVVDILEQLTAWVGHEYTNSAARMDIHLQRLRQEIPLLGDSQDGALGALERERKSMRGSTDAILRLTRTKLLGMGIGEGSLKSDLNLVVLLDEVIDMVESKAVAKGIALQAELSSARIAGDPQMFVVAALNLVENAVKYTPDGGTVEVSCVTRGDLVSVSVQDSGPGIPPAKREHVFDPGVRLSETESERGSGFGLALVREIVRLHRGKIAIRDSVDLGGADFHIQFPAAR